MDHAELREATARIVVGDDARRTRSGQRALEARRRVYKAVQSGRLTRGECERLGDDCDGRIEGHHDDYSKPLDVRWLCIRHHRQVEREQGQIRRHRGTATDP